MVRQSDIAWRGEGALATDPTGVYRVILADESGPERPLEALSFFSDVLHSHPDSIYASASRLESARAFAYLERHEEAIGAYREGIAVASHKGDMMPLHEMERRLKSLNEQETPAR